MRHSKTPRYHYTHTNLLTHARTPTNTHTQLERRRKREREGGLTIRRRERVQGEEVAIRRDQLWQIRQYRDKQPDRRRQNCGRFPFPSILISFFCETKTEQM